MKPRERISDVDQEIASVLLPPSKFERWKESQKNQEEERNEGGITEEDLDRLAETQKLEAQEAKERVALLEQMKEEEKQAFFDWVEKYQNADLLDICTFTPNGVVIEGDLCLRIGESLKNFPKIIHSIEGTLRLSHGMFPFHSEHLSKLPEVGLLQVDNVTPQMIDLVINLDGSYLPSHIKNIGIRYGISFGDTLPEGVEDLNLFRTPDKTVDGLPSSLKTIEGLCAGIEDLRGLPEHLESLILTESPISTANIFKRSLIKWGVVKADHQLLPNSESGQCVLPASLKHLYLQNIEGITHLEWLSEGIESISLRGLSISTVKGIPVSARRITLNSCRKLRSLDALSPEADIEYLSVENIPATSIPAGLQIKTIRIWESQKKLIKDAERKGYTLDILHGL